jgi:hypothetical protein
MNGQHGIDMRVPREVSGVQREQMGHGSVMHQRGESRVMNGDSRNHVAAHQSFPMSVGRVAFREHFAEPLDDRNPSLHAGDRMPVASSRGRGPRGDIPELGNILHRGDEGLAAANQVSQSFADEGMLRVVLLKET